VKEEAMHRLLLRWIVNCVALYAAVNLVPGVHWDSGWPALIGLGLVMVVVKVVVKPLAMLVGCLPILLTFGLFTLVINGFLFWLTGAVGQVFGIGFTVDGFWPAFLGGLVVSVVGIAMGWLLKDELRDRG
jgi:putative membrane protein